MGGYIMAVWEARIVVEYGYIVELGRALPMV